MSSDTGAAAAGSDSYPEIGGNDRRQLIGGGGEVSTSGTGPGFFSRHRWCLIVSTCILLICIGHAIAIYFIYFQCDVDIGNCAAIK